MTATPQDVTADLFRDDLEQRLSWIKGRDRAIWEHNLAWQYLDRGDYLRAAIFGLESAVSAQAKREGGDLNHWGAREAAHDNLKASPDFRILKNLRNGLAHGVLPADKKITRILRNPESLAAELRKLFLQLDIRRHVGLG